MDTRAGWRERRMTPAQWYALVFGIVLLVVGILGFFADSSFDAGSDVEGSNLLGFEVNGWHNIVHILSGLAGLAMFRLPASARAYALGFGAIYAVVTVWGLITGDQVLWLVPVNGADHVLHALIAIAGIAAGLVSNPSRFGVADEGGRRPATGTL